MAKQSAPEAYDAKRIEIDGLIATLEAKVKAHRAGQKKSPHYWTHVGDLAEVASRLAEINSFLGGE